DIIDLPKNGFEPVDEVMIFKRIGMPSQHPFLPVCIKASDSLSPSSFYRLHTGCFEADHWQRLLDCNRDHVVKGRSTMSAQAALPSPSKLSNTRNERTNVRVKVS